jgi:hypothetical protein
MMHPLRINMRLAQASAALLSGCQVCEEAQRQLQYADMLIKVSWNQDSTWCQEVERIDENTTTLDFPYLNHITKTNQVTDNGAFWMETFLIKRQFYVLIMKALINGMQMFRGWIWVLNIS